MRSSDFNVSKPIVYVDIDGVLADFFGEVVRKHGVENWRQVRKGPQGIDQVANDPGFFKNLPELSNAQTLINGVVQRAKKYSILTSPLMSNVNRSSAEKTAWIQRHFAGERQPSEIIMSHDKYHLAVQPDGTPNILIDDYPTNIALWNSWGGIGILYKNNEVKQALAKVTQALDGKIKPHPTPKVRRLGPSNMPKIVSNRALLRWIKRIHRDYQMDKPIMASDRWQLVDLPVTDVMNPEHYHQADPYHREIKLDLQHINSIDPRSISQKPIVVDSEGWVIDGNHRAIAAKMAGLKTIPAYVPYNDK